MESALISRSVMFNNSSREGTGGGEDVGRAGGGGVRGTEAARGRLLGGTLRLLLLVGDRPWRAP